MSHSANLLRVPAHCFPGAAVSFPYFARVAPSFLTSAEHGPFRNVAGDAEEINIRWHSRFLGDILGPRETALGAAVHGRHPVSDSFMDHGFDIDETGLELLPARDHFLSRPYYLTPAEVEEVARALAALDAEGAVAARPDLLSKYEMDVPEAVEAIERVQAFYERAAAAGQAVFRYSD